MTGSQPAPVAVSWLSVALVLLALCWGLLPALGRALLALGWAVQFLTVGLFWEVWERLRR